jgi:hypothetical protein
MKIATCSLYESELQANGIALVTKRADRHEGVSNENTEAGQE